MKRTNAELTMEVLAEVVAELKKNPKLVPALEEFERFMQGNGTKDDQGDRYGILMAFVTGLIAERPELIGMLAHHARQTQAPITMRH